MLEVWSVIVTDADTVAQDGAEVPLDCKNWPVVPLATKAVVPAAL